MSFSIAATGFRIGHRKLRVHTLLSYNIHTETQNHKKHLSHNFIFWSKKHCLLLLSSLLAPSPDNGDGWGLQTHRVWFLIFQNILESVSWKTINKAFCKLLTVMLHFSRGLWSIQSVFALSWEKCKSLVFTSTCSTTVIQTRRAPRHVQVTEALHMTIYHRNTRGWQFPAGFADTQLGPDRKC